MNNTYKRNILTKQKKYFQSKYKDYNNKFKKSISSTIKSINKNNY